MTSDAVVHVAWLEQHLADPSVRVLESSIAKESYSAAHVPGALWVDAHADLLRNGDDTSGEVLTPEQFAALMSRLGITPQMTVVWYGDRHNSYATRGFWTCDFYAHAGPLHVLQGGREAWLASRNPVESGAVDVPATVYPTPAAPNHSSRATLADVRAAIDDPMRAILDVRSLEEYDGTSQRAARSGHIPGAAHVEWTDATAGDNVLKTESALRELYETRGITPDKEIIAHCQLGVRASHTWFVLKHVLRYPRVRNYDGSWQEWGNRDDTPVER